MKKIIFVLISAVLLVFSACKAVEDPLVTELRTYIDTQSQPGVYQNSKALYVFDEDEMQLCWNTTTQMCRIQNDKANRYLTMTMSAAPVQGEKLTLKTVVSGTSVSLNPSYEVEVASVDADRHLVRLIEKETLLGFVLYLE